MSLTMCHCDEHTDDGEPNPDCDDHWEVGIPVDGYDEETGRVSRARDLTGGFRSRDRAQLVADALNADTARKGLRS